MKCPVCFSADIIDRGQFRDYPANLMYCKNCNTCFPSHFISDEEIKNFYQGFTFNYVNLNQTGFLQRLLFEKKINHKCRKIKQIIRKFNAGKNLLDFGGGCGYFAKGFHNAGFCAKMVEIDEKAIDIARNLGVDVYSLNNDIGRFDIVFSSHVIEHFKDPHTFFNYCNRYLQPQGLLILSCPNKDSQEFYRKDHVLGYIKILLNPPSELEFKNNPWFCIDPPRHFYSISKETIRELAKQFHYEILMEFSEYSTRYVFHHNDLYSLSCFSNLLNPATAFNCILINLQSFIRSTFGNKLGGDNLVVILKKQGKN